MLKHQRFDIIRDVVSADFCILFNRMGKGGNAVELCRVSEVQLYIR